MGSGDEGEGTAQKKFMIAGLGISGVACAKVLLSLGAKVYLADEDPCAYQREEVLELLRKGAQAVESHLERVSFDGVGALVVSPGVPPRSPLVRKATVLGIPVLSEIELALQIMKERGLSSSFVAVTGTNGKTTTVSLIGHILKQSGIPCVVAGNIGSPLVREIAKLTGAETVVLEVSSFQLKHTYSLRPKVAVLLNISSDHMDWHESFDDYVGSKYRIFQNQSQDDFAVINIDDRLLAEKEFVFNSRLYPFSADPSAAKEGKAVAFYEGSLAVFRGASGRKEELFDARDIPFGMPNRYNALAAALVCRLLGISPAQISRSVRSFEGLPHRLEFVREIDGVCYYNDSKATNPDSVIMALESFEGRKVVLICGGRDKGMDFRGLVEAIRKRAAGCVLIGESARKIAELLESAGFEHFEVTSSLEDAVEVASSKARPDGVVLFSPACASFDMFSNYEERGERFKAIVNGIASCKGR